MKLFALFTFWLLLLPFLSHKAQAQASQLIEETEQLIFIGSIDSAEVRINNGQKLYSKDYASIAHFYILAGEISKFQGDMDMALVNWNQSIAIRKKHLSRNDPIQAWNYALLSNYYYEKIQPLKALNYADSCSQFLKQLNDEELKSIKAHRIWNILAQSYKLQASNNGFNDYAEWSSIYKTVWAIYKKSLNFQKQFGTTSIDYAKTEHLLANSYNDMAVRAFATGHAKPDGVRYTAVADSLYNVVIAEWEKIYGNTSIQKARTLFVKGILQYILPESYYPSHLENAANTFRASIAAYSFDFKNINATHEHISNKTDFLMCLNVLMETLLAQSRTNTEIQLLDEATVVNHHAIKLWEHIHQSFQSQNINQLLSLYHLVPFKYSLFIEYERQMRDLSFSEEKIFTAVQYMRYFDLLKDLEIDGQNKSVVSLKEMQTQLHDNEVFIDFVYSTAYGIHVIAVRPNSFKVLVAGQGINKLGKELYNAIVNRNYTTYTETANQMYQLLLEPVLAPEISRIILCPTDFLQELPFEALLIQKPKATSTTDYRNLSFLIKDYSISYALSSAMYSNNTEKELFNLGLYLPDDFDDNDFADLPFGRKMANNLKKNITCTKVFSQQTTYKQLTEHQGILHISTHGLIEPINSETSTLLFGKKQLLLKDVYQLPVQSSLIVVNSCNSSLGDKLSEDGIDGFTRAFHQNGAKAVLSNLWEVDDHSSHQVLEHLYEFLYLGNTTEESLRLAKLKYLQESPNQALAAPYYWGGHLITGNKLVFEAPKTPFFNFSTNAYYLVLAFIAVMVALFIYLKNRKRNSN